MQHDKLEATLATADAVYNALNPTAIAGFKKAAADHELAAFNRGRGRGNSYNQRGQSAPRGGNAGAAARGAGRGASRRPKGNRAADNPPEDCCQSHWTYGKQAWNCLKPRGCPWAEFLTKPPK